MRIEHPKRDATIMASETSKFGFSQNSSDVLKTFKILVDNLYSDKPLSITREIWSNAFDSHKENGNPDQPFEITLPSSWEPAFRVRDFGTGLSHEDMMTKYPMLGYSTKDQDNNSVGKWGLGSKVPFAYTDTYAVTSWYNGMVRYYTCMKDSDGSPTINLMGEEPTDEPNGLEVAFPVKSDDTYKFREAANSASLGFDVKPIVSNDSDYSWPQIEIVKEFTDYSIIVIKQWYLKMGCVVYPINKGHFDCDLLKHFGLFFEVGIGDVDVTASREELSYDEETIAFLGKKFKEIEDTIVDDIISEVDWGQSDWKLRLQLCSIAGSSPPQVGSKLEELYGGNFKYLDIAPPIKTLPLCMASSYSMTGYTTKRFEDQTLSGLYVEERTIYVENTTKGKKDVRASRRIKDYLNENPDAYSSSPIWVRLDENNKNHLDEFNRLVTLVDAPIILVADLPDPGPETSSYSGYSKFSVQLERWDQSKGYFDYSYPDEETFKEGGLYFPILRGDPTNFGYNGDRHSGNLYYYKSSLIGLWKALSGDTRDVYVVPKTYWNKLKGDQWENALNVTEDYFDKHSDELIDYASESDDVPDMISQVASYHKDIAKLTEIDDQLKVGRSRVASVLGVLGYSWAQKPDKFEWVWQKYPLLKHLKTDVDICELKEYTTMIDEKENENDV